MRSIGKIIDDTRFKNRPKNLSKEFQVYGVYLAEQLDDTKRYSMYIKLAKQYDRGILEEALNFAKGYNAAKSKPRVFMWKLTQLRKLQKELHPNENKI